MRRKSLADLPDLEVPVGLALRTFRVGDEGGWATVMTGAIGVWDKESTARLFLSDPGVNAESIFFLVDGDHYIATATDKRLLQSELGYLHMVAVAPPHRGNGLGRCISVAAVIHMRDRGCREAILDTDDFRLPAIRTYLSLGFMPEMLETDHADRWAAIAAELDSARHGR